MGFVDFAVAKAHVKADADVKDEDDLLKVYLGAAEERAMSFMDRRVYATRQELEAAALEHTAGIDPTLANDAMRAAVLLIFGHLCVNREDVVVGASAVKLPNGAQYLLQPYRIGMGV